jgi:hypothetical protein
MIAIPSRQIHLDFHTSEHIPDVGTKFDKKQFQQALKVGRVNWINIFAKCHHGWSYYPTDVGQVHPSMVADLDLLGQQIEACHEIGVRAPIYYTVGWSANDAEEHPEWCVRQEDGSINALFWDFEAKPDDGRPYTSWKFLCPSGDYLNLMLEQTVEICERYPVDGFWYDITNGPICYCQSCRQGMAAEGVDRGNLDEVIAYNSRKWQHFMSECNRVVRNYHPEATFFYNGTTILYANPVMRDTTSRLFDFNTQQELEDLPTTWGGYDKFPLRSKFFHNTAKPIIAMSGKFHTSWGEFGGFKHPDALRYEVAAMIAFGAGCNFGDQLHPGGEMDMATYRNIGLAFEYVEQIEAYGVGGRPVSNLGLWFSGVEDDDEGVARMLLETQKDFLVVEPEADLSNYDVIILPGAACLTEDQAEKLNVFAQNNGGLLILGESALDRQKQKFLVDVGATYIGPANFDEDYLLVGETLGEGLVSSPFFNYEAALRVQPDGDAEVLAAIREPYFNRTYAKYCSHRNTPDQLAAAKHPGALRKGNVVFLPHRLGKLYFEHGARLHRDLFSNALGLIQQDPMVKTELPSAGRISLLHQPDENRYVAHLLYGPALQRGYCLVIEDLVPLFDVPLEVRVPQRINKVYLAPSKQTLTVEQVDGAVKVIVPELRCHQAVVFEY